MLSMGKLKPLAKKRKLVQASKLLAAGILRMDEVAVLTGLGPKTVKRHLYRTGAPRRAAGKNGELRRNGEKLRDLKVLLAQPSVTVREICIALKITRAQYRRMLELLKREAE